MVISKQRRFIAVLCLVCECSCVPLKNQSLWHITTKEGEEPWLLNKRLVKIDGILWHVTTWTLHLNASLPFVEWKKKQVGFFLIEACQSVIWISHGLLIYLIVELYTLVLFLGHLSGFSFFFFLFFFFSFLIKACRLCLVIKALSASC